MKGQGQTASDLHQGTWDGEGWGYRVMRMRLKASRREESPTRLLEQLRRIHQQTVQTADGQKLSGLTEIAALQKSLFAALDLPQPTPTDLAKPHL